MNSRHGPWCGSIPHKPPDKDEPHKGCTLLGLDLWVSFICSIICPDHPFWELQVSPAWGARPFVKPRCTAGKQVGLGLGMDGPGPPPLLPQYASGPGWVQITHQEPPGTLGIEAICSHFNLQLEQPIHNSNVTALNCTHI